MSGVAVVYRHCNATVAHLPGVAAAVADAARPIAARARASLAEHRHTGASKIEVSHSRIDTLISLVDPAALSIEFGHTDKRSGRPVEGLYILTRAAG